MGMGVDVPGFEGVCMCVCVCVYSVSALVLYTFTYITIYSFFSFYINGKYHELEMFRPQSKPSPPVKV